VTFEQVAEFVQLF